MQRGLESGPQDANSNTGCFVHESLRERAQWLMLAENTFSVIQTKAESTLEPRDFSHERFRKPKVLIVGTFHFGGSLDYVQEDIDNMLSEKRQEEMQEVIRQLAKFNPTKVAVEVVKEDDNYLNQQFENFLNNKYDLTVNEVHQIGFRLAKEMKHQNIYPVDWMGDVGSRSIDEVLDWAKDHQSELYDLITKVYIPMLETKYDDLTLQEILRILNEKDRIHADHSLYMNVALIGEDTNYVGIDWLRWWYQRNLIIYHNIIKLIKDTDDRILLLIGAGHVHLISQFLSESGLVEIEEVDNYL